MTMDVVSNFMKLLNFIFIILIGQLFMECNYKSHSDPPEVKTEYGVIREEVEEVSPPPPGPTSNFKTLEEWLFNICDKEKPEKSITTYIFGLFESADDYTIFLVGINKYDKGQDSVTRIDFEPSNMYYPLSKSENKNLTQEQVQDQLTTLLRDFIKTDKFKNSFLAKAYSITVEFYGMIWSR